MTIGLIVLLLSLAVLTARAYHVTGDASDFPVPLRGLGLPRGSVRSLIALAIVGGFLVFAFFGYAVMTKETFTQVLTAFAALTGSVTGFYFGGRTGIDLSGSDAALTEAQQDKAQAEDGDVDAVGDIVPGEDIGSE